MTNWKTTVAGAAAAALNMFANGANWKQILLSTAMLVFGAMAKDHDVTGGTKTQQ